MNSYHELRKRLADAYTTATEWRQAAKDIGLDPNKIALLPTSQTAWSNILGAVHATGQMSSLRAFLVREQSHLLSLFDDYAAATARGEIVLAIDIQTPHLLLTRYEARTKRAIDGSDAMLLSAYRADVIPLLGRQHALADLRRWLALDRGISIRVMTGSAGRGKTRLALELVREVARNGWLAGFVEEGELDRFLREPNVAEWARDTPALIVVDYAAGRADQLRDWIGKLADAPEGRQPLRLLLLERHASCEIGWLATSIVRGNKDGSRAVASLLDPPEPVELAAIEDLPLRRQIFATLLARKRDDLVPPDIGADAAFDHLLRQEKWSGDPLFLMMAGLVAGTHGINNALSLNRTDLATFIAEHELKRIGDIAARRAGDPDAKGKLSFLARHAAVLATLCQGLKLEDARTLIKDEAVSLDSPADINTTVSALRDGLSGTGDGLDIAPILPDIVGEAAIMCWLGDGGVLRDLGIDPLSSVKRAAETALERSSLTLVRTVQDFVAAGRDEPIRWLRAIAQAREDDLDALATIADALPYPTLALLELAAELSQSIVDRLRSGDPEGQTAEEVLGVRLVSLGLRLTALARHEEALAASQEAVALGRRLADAGPDAFLPHLAWFLGDYGMDLSALGRREEALAAAQEALAITRRLANDRPDAFLPDLALRLQNVGIYLSALDRNEEALTASQEALRITRGLAEDRPDALSSGLARSLNSVGHYLYALGRRKEALIASQEALAIRRRLADERPDDYLAALASSLNSVGYHLFALGRREEALTASQEALAIRRRLADTRPDAFLPDLASSMSNQNGRLFNLGQREEAVVTAHDAIAIFRNLVETRPGVFLPYLAGSLTNLCYCLFFLGRYHEALPVAQEVVAIERELAEAHPEIFLPSLALGLNNLAGTVDRLGRHEEALAVSQKALSIFRSLAVTRPDAFKAELALSLTTTSECLSSANRSEEALEAAREAVDIRQHLAEAHPATFLPLLAWNFKSLGQILAQAQQHTQTADTFREGLAVIATPFIARYTQVLGDVAGALSQGYNTACKNAGIVTDAGLLERVARAIKGGGIVDSDPENQ